MGIGKTLQEEILDIGIMVMLVVILSVVLLKMKISSSVACEDSFFFNASRDICHLPGNVSNNASVTPLVGDIDVYVAAFSEPKNWVVIIIIGLIAIMLIRLFLKLRKNST